MDDPSDKIENPEMIETPAAKSPARRGRRKAAAAADAPAQDELSFTPEESSGAASPEGHAATGAPPAAGGSGSLLSSFLPNLGGGLLSLSKGGSGGSAPPPVVLPPPKSHGAKDGDRRRGNADGAAASQGAAGVPLPPPASRGGKGATPGVARGAGKNGGRGKGNPAMAQRFVLDEEAFADDFMDADEFPEIPPAYVEEDEERIVDRPRIDRYEFTKTAPEILRRISEELEAPLPSDGRGLDGFFDDLLARNAARNGVNELTFGAGVVEIGQGGYAFLRSAEANYRATPQDIYLTPLYVKRYGLRPGDAVLGVIKRRESETMSAMVKVYAINGIDPRQRHGLRTFESLTPYYPTQRIWLEASQPGRKSDLTMRVMDLVTPIGRGQRGLIVAPPRTGKTIMLQEIANSILTNEENRDITLIVVLIDERPEEVTDMKNLVNAEIVSSTFDEQPEHHAALAEIVYERAKRLVENGRHVAILLDSITRLARAYNTLAPKSGRILSGGLDSNALYKPKRFFGAARNIRGGGSLTILGTALIDTGSRMDDLIFEEFKGTGNMELHLDRTLADRRIFPAINILKSGTRKEDLIVQEDALEVMWFLRKGLALKSSDPAAPMEQLLRSMRERDSNALFLHDVQTRMRAERP